ncbi:hypothetical protein [Actinoplanes solisilvae]|uniref:hypothetical protein n=1 Tax=Actinoplanes solisilvae TaxID=2486853 RepID=UPI000FD8FDB8|nr:hypothetical protein [Actinoplanes solisilvae]
MSYPVQPPPIAAAPPASPSGRPPAVTVAAALLWLMAGVGLIYAIATLAVVPGTVSRFREVAGGGSGFTGDNDPEYYVAVVWLGAAIAMALAVIAFALFVVIGLSLRRGSNVARIATLVVCALGLLGGIGSILTVVAQRSGDSVPLSLGGQLSEAYPGGWLGTNTGLSVAQILGYAVVGILVLTAPRAFFRRPAAPTVPQQAYGMPYPGYGAPGVAQAPTGYPAPGLAPPAVGYPGAGHPGSYPATPPSGPSTVPGGYPSTWEPAVPHPPGGYTGGPGYPGVSYEAPAPGSDPGPNSAQTHPATDHSFYARPAGHAPDSPFAPPEPSTPTAAQLPLADPHSPYARPQAQPAAAPAGQPPSGLHEGQGRPATVPADSPQGQTATVPADSPQGQTATAPADSPQGPSAPSSADGSASSAPDRPVSGVEGGTEAQPPTAS